MFERTEKLKELCSAHPSMLHPGAAVNICAISALSHIYPSLYPPANASFGTFQSKLQTSVHCTPEHFNCFMLNLDNLPAFKIRRYLYKTILAYSVKIYKDLQKNYVKGKRNI